MKKRLNIEEELNIREEYYTLGVELCDRIMGDNNSTVKKIVIFIGGESGSGKSTTAICLDKEFNKRGITCTTLHMDSYYKLPPKDNHQNRLKSLSNVGAHELNMKLLDDQIIAFKEGQKSITVPIVNYTENSFSNKELDLSNLDVLIIEGVYSFILRNADHKIFLSRTYHDTMEKRKQRTRETYDPFVETVLEIEHKIVSPLISDADFIINKDYSIA